MPIEDDVVILEHDGTFLWHKHAKFLTVTILHSFLAEMLGRFGVSRYYELIEKGKRDQTTTATISVMIYYNQELENEVL